MANKLFCNTFCELNLTIVQLIAQCINISPFNEAWR